MFKCIFKIFLIARKWNYSIKKIKFKIKTIFLKKIDRNKFLSINNLYMKYDTHVTLN